MEVQEIIKIVSGRELSPLSECDGVDKDVETNNEAIREAVSLLKKQVPEMVIPAHTTLKGWYRCPACSEITARRGHVLLPSYCRFCGQALSWEEGQDGMLG